jgi:uncharacterized protein YggE
MSFSITRPLAAAMVAGLVFSAIPAQAQVMNSVSPNAIQPETTLSISATSDVKSAPDVAYLTGGVVSTAPTAREALQMNANDMAGVYKALEAAGLEKKNIQTSNFSIQPQYTYPENAERILNGYQVSNQVTAKVTDLDKLGSIIDAMVAQGGNTFSGIQFAVEDPSDLVNEARRDAIKDAMARAQLYADATGYSVARIVTISENEIYSPQPQPKMMARAMMSDGAESTQISGGEISYSATVNVTFEFRK